MPCEYIASSYEIPDYKRNEMLAIEHIKRIEDERIARMMKDIFDC